MSVYTVLWSGCLSMPRAALVHRLHRVGPPYTAVAVSVAVSLDDVSAPLICTRKVTTAATAPPSTYSIAAAANRRGMSVHRTRRLVSRHGVAVGILYLGPVDTATGRAAMADPQIAPILARLPRSMVRGAPVGRAAP